MGKLIKEFISSEIKPWMKQLGYRKRANSFSLRREDFFLLINFQGSQWNTADEESFYINCVVFFHWWQKNAVRNQTSTRSDYLITMLRSLIGDMNRLQRMPNQC